LVNRSRIRVDHSRLAARRQSHCTAKTIRAACPPVERVPRGS
jgi:hypothetical protein